MLHTSIVHVRRHAAGGVLVLLGMLLLLLLSNHCSLHQRTHAVIQLVKTSTVLRSKWRLTLLGSMEICNALSAVCMQSCGCTGDHLAPCDNFSCRSSHQDT